jgi:hypothetical protein
MTCRKVWREGARRALKEMDDLGVANATFDEEEMY